MLVFLTFLYLSCHFQFYCAGPILHSPLPLAFPIVVRSKLSLLFFSFTSSSEPSLVSCWGHGTCELKAGVQVCECQLFFNPADNCQVSFFEIYNGKDLPYPIVRPCPLIVSRPQVLMSLFILSWAFLTLELSIDVQRGRKHLRRSAILAKIFLWVYFAFRVAHFAVWIVRSLHGFDAVPVLAESVLQALGPLFAFLTVAYVVVAWVELVTRIKTLGREVGRQLYILRRVLIISTIVLGPLVCLSPPCLLSSPPSSS